MAETALQQAQRLLRILNTDLPRMEKLDRYARGVQDDPYIPDSADAEYRLLAQRCKTNAVEFTIATSTQPLKVDSFRPTDNRYSAATDAAWRHFQRSRMESRQHSIYRAAAIIGHSFTVTEKHPIKGVITRGLSPLRTAAIYEDPATDDSPLAALTVEEWPSPERSKRGRATLWDTQRKYVVTFGSLGDSDSVVILGRGTPHGCEECPVTRFHLLVDLEGRTTGVVEPMIPLQDRLNQTVFDLLVTQTFASFKVRTVSGMAPPMETRPVKDPDGTVIGAEPAIDEQTGRPIPANVNLSAKRFMFASDKDVKFGTLDETPLDGFINSINMTMRQLAALSQTPPHHMLGEIANLSAEALQAAEQALQRKVGEFQASFGEAWERTFRLAAELENITHDSDGENMVGEVMWRDMNGAQLAQAGDALGKFAETLGIPKRGLWERIPGVTKAELDYWLSLLEEENEERQMREAIERGMQSNSERPSFREEAEPEPETVVA